MTEKLLTVAVGHIKHQHKQTQTETDLGLLCILFMHGSRKFCQRGSKFDDVFIFLLDEG